MWIPLHLHSQYSILDASASVKAIAGKAAECKMPAVALTDHGNMYGAVDFYKECKEMLVKPIIGCELYVAPLSRLERKKSGPFNKAAYHLILLAKDESGYRNLCRLSSLGFLEGFYYHPRVDKELLKKYSEGLICLSACMSSEVAQMALHSSENELEEVALWYKDLFGDDYYFELQRHTMEPQKLAQFEESWLLSQYHEYIANQEKINNRLIKLSEKLDIKYVATNDTHYIEASDWKAHEILLNIATGEPCEIWEKDSHGNNKFRVPNPKRRVYSTHECYFKTPEQMQELFIDLPLAISNTLEIAQKCNLALDFTSKHYPVYSPPTIGPETTAEKRSAAAENYLKDLCEQGIKKRYTQERLDKVGEKYPDSDPGNVVRERLEHELAIIISSQGMCDYLLIVWDFINWAKSRGIPVGPGRGSGAGSIILYLIGVTDIEPLRFHLFFERFINPERISYPDIDVDICMDRRHEVIDYTISKYGKENVAQIITFGTMKAKMVIRDVGRVLSVPLAKVNTIASLVPEDPNMTLEKALEIDAELHHFATSDEEGKKIIDLGRRLEGSIRNTGIHAAGVIISGEPLMEHIPVCLAKDSDMLATQFSMKPVEAVGMLKIDFLGLKTLTGFKICVDAIKAARGIDIDWVNLSLEDEKAYRLLQEGRTLGIFQMESGGMQELARQLHPDKFEEIIAIGALYRPGPMEMIPSFVARKHGKEAIEYDHPWLESILAETYGIMVYQEQVMQIASRLANYSLGEGDVLRKAMGKKDAAQMAKEREKFRRGALQNEIPDALATEIFDKMEKFASYGFNKSHAAAYGYLTYATAYFKANFPKEWMAALMTCDSDDISKVAKFIRECQAMDILILPPDVNEAGREFTATAHGIRFAMNGIKGVGEGAVIAIIEERQARGPFKNFYDFFKRIDLKRVGKKVIEVLVEAGSFDFTSWSRDEMLLSIEMMYEAAGQEQKEASLGIRTFFSMMGEDKHKQFTQPPKVVRPRPKAEWLKKEKELLGFFLTGHPMDDYKQILGRLSCVSLDKIDKLPLPLVIRASFIIESIKTRISQKSGKKFAILMISDGIESYELPIWPELFEQKGPLLNENQLLYAILQVEKRDEQIRLQCRWLGDLTQISEEMIEECDKAFDRAKIQASRFTPPTPKATEAPQSPPKKETLHHLKIDLNVVRLTQIMKLKELFTTHHGKEKIKIIFTIGERPFSELRFTETKGISLSPTLKTELSALGFDLASN